MRAGLITSLIILALSGCTPRVISVFAAPKKDPEINSVSTVVLPAGQTARSVTLVSTESPKGAGGAIPTGSEQGVLELTEIDSGRSIEITLGTRIVLHLISQPSTGYTWVIDELDQAILLSDGEPQYISTSNLEGAEGTMIWKFKPIATGNTTLKLIYARSFGNKQFPLKTFELTVEIGKR